MSDWRSEAIKRFSDIIDTCDEFPFVTDEGAMASAGMLWDKLGSVFSHAYSSTPRNDDHIHRIYDFANWCIIQGDTEPDNLASTALVGFIESIPLYPPAMEDVPRWFTIEVFEDLKAIFCYFLTEEQFEQHKKRILENADQYRGVFSFLTELKP